MNRVLSLVEHDYQRSCKGKQNHADPIWALWACGEIYKKWGDPGLFPYKCRFCPNYHIGHIHHRVRQFIQDLIGPEEKIERCWSCKGSGVSRPRNLANKVRKLKRKT